MVFATLKTHFLCGWLWLRDVVSHSLPAASFFLWSRLLSCSAWLLRLQLQSHTLWCFVAQWANEQFTDMSFSDIKSIFACSVWAHDSQVCLATLRAGGFLTAAMCLVFNAFYWVTETFIKKRKKKTDPVALLIKTDMIGSLLYSVLIRLLIWK